METWPEGLRPLLEGSQVTRVSGFEASSPMYGPAYVRKTTDDTPTIIKGSLRFTQNEARRFQAFLRRINNGLDQFTMPIKSEYGVVDQVCQALPGSFNPSRQGDVYTYNIELVIREWALPPFYEYEDEFLDIGWFLPDYFGIFDEAINHGLTGQ